MDIFNSYVSLPEGIFQQHPLGFSETHSLPVLVQGILGPEGEPHGLTAWTDASYKPFKKRDDFNMTICNYGLWNVDDTYSHIVFKWVL